MIKSFRNPTMIHSEMLCDILLMCIGVLGSILPNFLSHFSCYHWAAPRSALPCLPAIKLICEFGEFFFIQFNREFPKPITNLWN